MANGYKVLTDYTLTYERESSWGTEKDTTPIGIPTEDMVFNMEPDLHRLNRSWGYRGQHESNTWNDTFSTNPTATCSMIMTQEMLRDLLPGLLQADSDYSAASEVWTMFTGNYADLPQPKTNGDGYFYTLCRNSPASADDEVITSAIVQSMTLKIGATDDEGILMADVEFLGKDYSRGATQGGTISHMALTNMYKWGNITTASGITFGSADLTSDFVSAEISITANAKHVSDIPDGEYVFPKWDVTTTIKCIANADTEAIKTKVLSRDVDLAEQLVIAFGTSKDTPAADSDLVFTSHAYATGWDSDYAEGEVITFTFEGVFGNTAADEYPARFEFFIAE